MEKVSRSRVASPAPRTARYGVDIRRTAPVASVTQKSSSQEFARTRNDDDKTKNPFFGIIGYVVGRFFGTPIYMSGLLVYIIVRPIVFVIDVIRATMYYVLFIPWLIFDIFMYVPRLMWRLFFKACTWIAFCTLAVFFVAFLAFLLSSPGEKMAASFVDKATQASDAAFPVVMEYGDRLMGAAALRSAEAALFIGQTVQAGRAYIESAMPPAVGEAWASGSSLYQSNVWAAAAAEAAAVLNRTQAAFGNIQDHVDRVVPGAGVSTEIAVLGSSALVCTLALYVGWLGLDLCIRAALWPVAVFITVVTAPFYFLVGIVRGLYDSTSFWRAVLQLKAAN